MDSLTAVDAPGVHDFKGTLAIDILGAALLIAAVVVMGYYSNAELEAITQEQGSEVGDEGGKGSARATGRVEQAQDVTF